MAVWSVYLIRCAHNSVYTGIATNVERRFGEHETGTGGAKYLRGRSPLELIFQQEIGDRALASKVEYRIKQMPRREKTNVEELPAMIDEMIRKFDQ